MGKTVFDLVNGKTIFFSFSSFLAFLFQGKPYKKGEIQFHVVVDFRVTGKIGSDTQRPCAKLKSNRSK